jgi:microcystin-dependent protein
MSYIINKRNGTQLTTIIDGTTDTTASSLTLVGQNYIGWGEIFQENLVHLMENFARSAIPANALVGQLWFDTTNKNLNVLVAEDIWHPLATTAAGTSAPQSPNVGDFWYDTNRRQVRVWDSVKWQIVGPVYTATQGPTGANAVSIADSLNTPRHTVTLESKGATFAIFNPTYEFTTLANVDGFGNVIHRGFNFRSNISSEVLFHGTVQNAMTLQGIEPGVFVRGDQDDYTLGNLYIQNDGGLWLGSNAEARITNEPVSNNIIFALSKNETNFRMTGLYDNGEKVLLQSNVQSGLLTVNDDPLEPTGISTKNYTDNTVSQAEQRQNTNLVSNVVAINTTIGTLTNEINQVNNYAHNVEAIKANIASPIFTGTPAAPTAAAGTNTTQVATTAFVKTAVDTGIAGVTATVDARLAAFQPLPVGGIIMWSGAVNNIPSGWALCNGSNGTPDLRNRFIVGAGSGYNVAATGGSADAVVPAHSHTITDPGHSHLMQRVLTDINVDARFDAVSRYATSDDAEYTDRNTVNSVTGITINSTGQSGVNANLPPYYALCFIIKTA